MENKAHRIVLFTILLNILFMGAIIYQWCNEYRLSDEEIFKYSILIALLMLNVFVLSNFKYFNIRAFKGIFDSEKFRIISLYFKRKQLEEEKRIRDLESSKNDAS